MRTQIRCMVNGVEKHGEGELSDATGYGLNVGDFCSFDFFLSKTIIKILRKDFVFYKTKASLTLLTELIEDEG